MKDFVCFDYLTDVKSASSLVGQITDLHLDCGLLKSHNFVGITLSLSYR